MSIFSFISPKKPKPSPRRQERAPVQERTRVDSAQAPHQTPPQTSGREHFETEAQVCHRVSPQDTRARIEVTKTKIADVKRKHSRRHVGKSAAIHMASNAAFRLAPQTLPSPLVVKESEPSPSSSRPEIRRQPTTPILYEGQVRSSEEILSCFSSSSSDDSDAPPPPSRTPRHRHAPYPTRRSQTHEGNPSSVPSRLKTLRRSVSQRLPKITNLRSGETSRPQTPAGISMPFNSGRCCDAGSSVPAWRYESMRKDFQQPMLM